jgi:hypothetical protein
MAEWAVVRYDPTYEEPLDPEIIPLCDALNASGFVTTSSCCGHGRGWPYVCFEHSTDERIESLARFVKAQEGGDYRPYFSMWQKEILTTDYAWCVEIHLNNVYAKTPQAEALKEAVSAIAKVAEAVSSFQQMTQTFGCRVHARMLGL